MGLQTLISRPVRLADGRCARARQSLSQTLKIRCRQFVATPPCVGLTRRCGTPWRTGTGRREAVGKGGGGGLGEDDDAPPPRLFFAHAVYQPTSKHQSSSRTRTRSSHKSFPNRPVLPLSELPASLLSCPSFL